AITLTNATGTSNSPIVLSNSPFMNSPSINGTTRMNAGQVTNTLSFASGGTLNLTSTAQVYVDDSVTFLNSGSTNENWNFKNRNTTTKNGDTVLRYRD